MSKLDVFLWLTVKCLLSQKFRRKTMYFRTEIHGTVLKQLIRIGYLIKQKPRGTLAEKQVLTEELLQEVGSSHLVFL